MSLDKVVTRPRLRRAVPALVLAVLAAGCSSKGRIEQATALPQTPKAQAATLQHADFPPGFEPQQDAPGEGLNIDQLWAELSRCLGVDATAGRTGVATSPTFLRGLATQARASVEYTSEASANAIAAAVNGPKFDACAKEAFSADVKRSAPEGAVPGAVAVAAGTAPAVAPRISAFRVTVTLDMSELKVPLFQDFIVAVDGDAVIRLLFLNPGSEFPQDLERSLVEKVVSRA